MTKRRYQMGVSMIELMLALAIGSFVVMLAVKLYADGNRLLSRAQVSSVQVDTASAVDDIGKGIMLAGLGMPIGAGQAVLLSQPATLPQMEMAWLSRSSTTQATPPYRSDQLTIQYRAPMDMWDCEGAIALGPRQARLDDGQLVRVDGQVVIERYFIDREEDGSFALRCDAARYITEAIQRDSTRDRRGAGSAVMSAIIDEAVPSRQGVKKPYQLQGLGDRGVVLLNDIDGLWVRYVVDETGVLSVNDAAVVKQKADARIIGVQLTMLQKSANHSNDTARPITVANETIQGISSSSHRLWLRDVHFVNVSAAP